MRLNRDIQPISNMKRQSAKLLKQLEESGDPIILTRNGRPCVVVQDAEAYQGLMDMKERYETMLKVRQGLDDVKHKHTRPADVVLAELDKKHEL